MQTYIPTESELREAISSAVKDAVQNELPGIIREATAKPWLTKQELMQLTGWSSRTIQNLRDTQQIPYSQHGYKILYPRKGIFEFLEQNHIKPREKS